jgi:hypothetical protein
MVQKKKKCQRVCGCSEDYYGISEWNKGKKQQYSSTIATIKISESVKSNAGGDKGFCGFSYDGKGNEST